jgi:hypothetical protein
MRSTTMVDREVKSQPSLGGRRRLLIGFLEKYPSIVTYSGLGAHAGVSGLLSLVFSLSGNPKDSVQEAKIFYPISGPAIEACTA